MSVIIKGMKMPTGCITCPCMSFGRDDCTMWCKWLDEPLGEWSNRGGKWRHPDCPMVEVPTPHGRLIDGEIAKEELRRAEALTRAFGYHNVIETISEVPTIIEAEEGEEA